jgi:hypothetical protein
MDQIMPVSSRKEGQLLMTQEEIHALVRQFAAPLAPHITSTRRKEGAEKLVKYLWTAMICGPEMEEETWRVFREKGQLDDDMIDDIKQCYENKMKPMVSEEQLAALRQRYQVNRKQ